VVRGESAGVYARLDREAALVVVGGESTRFYVRFGLHFQSPASDFAALCWYMYLIAEKRITKPWLFLEGPVWLAEW
jgi:hypothetical protein